MEFSTCKKRKKVHDFVYLRSETRFIMEKTKEMSKVNAMRYVLKHPCGSISQLRDAIGEDRVLEFEYLGYIRNGISQTDVTYHRTSSVQIDYETFYKKPRFWNAIPSIIFGSLAKLFA